MSTEQSAGMNAHHAHAIPTRGTADDHKRHGANDTPIETSFVRPSDLLRPRLPSKHDPPIDRDERAGLVSPPICCESCAYLGCQTNRHSSRKRFEISYDCETAMKYCR